MIAVNGRFRHQPATGVQRYATEVVAHLGSDHRQPVVEELVPLRGAAGGALGKVWDLGLFPLAARQRARSADVLLSLCNWGPVTSGRRSVVVVHDDLVGQVPAFYSASYRATSKAYFALLRRSSAVVVTVSSSSRAALERRLGRAVAVAPCGVRAPSPSSLSRGSEHLGRRRLELPDRYALFVGSHDARKNLAFAESLRPALAARGLSLVATGRRAPSTTRSSTPGLETVVVESPDDDELWALYGSASIVLHPSIAEGFGLPLLEASAVGTPWISSPVGAASELAVAEGQVVELREDLWSRAIGEVLGSSSLLAPLLLAQAARYSWSRTAEALLDACEAI